MGELFSGTLTGSQGSKLTITNAELTTAAPSPGPTPTPTPAPAPTPTPNPAPGPLASTRKRILWHFGWTGPALSSYPVDVKASVTTVVLAMSQSAGSGTGRLTTPPKASQGEVVALRQAGVDVLVGVGGSVDGGITITNQAQVADAMASIQGMAKSLGINGVVWDLEGTPGAKWNVQSITDLSKSLIGAGFKVGICSATWGGRDKAWGAVAHNLGAGLYSWERMFYDFDECADNRLVGIVASDVAMMKGYVADDSQIVCTFMGTPPEGNYPRASPTPAVITAAYRPVCQRYPKVGWSVWEDRIENGRGWVNLRALAAV